MNNPFKARDIINTSKGNVVIYRLSRLEELGIANISRLPYSIKLLLEFLLRCVDGKLITEEDVMTCASWAPGKTTEREIPFIPSRVLMQDFTGVPAIVDLAAMRSAVQRLGRDPARINPVIPVDLVIDHSVEVDYYGTSYARTLNEKREFERNHERYALLRWTDTAFDNFRVIPPGRGIVHQINLEYLSTVVQVKKVNNELVAYPDTLVGKFVEFCGPGLARLSLPDRATISNMAPEYGATVGFFPIDDITLQYLLGTGRKKGHVDLVRSYAIEQGLFLTENSPLPLFSEIIELDMETVEPSLAGPKRPQDRIPLDEMETSFNKFRDETFL